MPLKKKTEEPQGPRIDTEMVRILEDQVKWTEGDVLRARQFLREKELRLDEKTRKLNHYLKTGELLTEEQLRK
jgi:hypothetical protein